MKNLCTLACLSLAFLAYDARSAFGWPLVIGGLLKAIYDLLLLLNFRSLRPPEEREIRVSAGQRVAESRSTPDHPR